MAALSVAIAMAYVSIAARIGDRARLAQVLDNLLSNALRFTPPGGRVRVRAGVEGGEAVLEVADDGPGIAPEDQGRLFERFFRTEAAIADAVQDPGPGLAIAKMMVEAHGGEIAVQSALGAGATFRVRLPPARRGPGRARAAGGPAGLSRYAACSAARRATSRAHDRGHLRCRRARSTRITSACGSVPTLSWIRKRSCPKISCWNRIFSVTSCGLPTRVGAAQRARARRTRPGSSAASRARGRSGSSSRRRPGRTIVGRVLRASRRRSRAS